MKVDQVNRTRFEIAARLPQEVQRTGPASSLTRQRSQFETMVEEVASVCFGGVDRDLMTLRGLHTCQFHNASLHGSPLREENGQIGGPYVRDSHGETTAVRRFQRRIATRRGPFMGPLQVWFRRLVPRASSTSL